MEIIPNGTIRVCVLVHPVNTLAHHTVPPGYRWAVHVGNAYGDLSTCMNAGWEPTRDAAALSGEAAGVCAVKMARLFIGNDPAAARMETVFHDFDPIPAGGDRILQLAKD